MKQRAERIIFLDVMRALAVFMMVQGHTVHTLLSNEYRNESYFLFSLWHYLRGFTAPIFMFTAGVVFTYLFKLSGKPFGENPRVKKGIKRFFLLLGLGYLLRYPTWRILDFSIVTQREWNLFFVVDALHLIAFGILSLIFLLWLSEKTNFNFNFFAIFVTLFVVAVSSVVKDVDWTSFLPLPVANYFTDVNGSIFPLFPWLAYVIAGGVLGNFIAANKGVQKKATFSIALLAFGTGLVLSALLLKYFFIYGPSDKNVIFQFLVRIGVVIALNGIVALTVLRFSNVPRFVKQIGRNTLFVYVIHLIILYGSAWNPGLSKIVGPVLSFRMTLFSVILMFAFVYGMIILREKLGKFRKQKLALLEI